MNDFLIDDVSIHLATSKNKSYQQRVRARFNAFVSFLEKNLLLSAESKISLANLSDTTKIMKSDLSEKGWLLVKLAYDKWLRSIDRSQNPEDVRILEKELKKLALLGNDKKE